MRAKVATSLPSRALSAEDMDNADIISMVENSPTYLRDKSTLNSIKMKAEQEGQLATEAAQEAEGGAGGVITF